MHILILNTINKIHIGYHQSLEVAIHEIDHYHQQPQIMQIFIKSIHHNIMQKNIEMNKMQNV